MLAGVSLRGCEPKNWSDASGPMGHVDGDAEVSRGHQGGMVGPWVPRITAIGGQTAPHGQRGTCDGPSRLKPEMASLMRYGPLLWEHGRRRACLDVGSGRPIGLVLSRSGQAREKSRQSAQCGSREVRVNARRTKEGKAARYVGQELAGCAVPHSFHLVASTNRGRAWADLG